MPPLVTGGQGGRGLYGHTEQLRKDLLLMVLLHYLTRWNVEVLRV